MSGGIQTHAIFMTQQLLKAPASVINTWKAVSVSSPGAGVVLWRGAVWTQSIWRDTGQLIHNILERNDLWRNCEIVSKIYQVLKNVHGDYKPKFSLFELKVRLWKLSDLLLRLDHINTKQVGYTLDDMRSKVFYLSSCRSLMQFTQFAIIWLKISKHSNMFSDRIRMWAALEAPETFFLQSPFGLTVGLHKTPTMGSFPLMETLACHDALLPLALFGQFGI